MASEHQEQQATNHALDTLANWMKAGTHEGISFEVSRLTNDLFTDSFLGGGDASRFTASGHRGTLTSQLSNANILDSNGGVPHQFPIQFAFDLNTGKAAGNWNNPVTAQAEAVTVTLTFFKSATRPEGKYYIFFSDESSDKAGYTFTFLLL
ncbi:MAG: hypothetical protein ABSF92_02050 [Candidatus Acidiferrales bacterium]|jgi:hypothetical protein